MFYALFSRNATLRLPLLFSLLLIASLFSVHLSCKLAPPPPPAMPPVPDPTVAYHTGDYLAQWAEIDSLEAAGLPQSALQKVEALYQRAKADNNQPQVIKTLMYRGKFAVMLEDDGLIKAIQLFESEEKTAAQPDKAILQSMLGQVYSTYLHNQYWRISDRTPIPDGEGGDILTWSADQIERKALEWYGLSVSDEAALRAIPIDFIKDISLPGLNDSVGTAPLRPTVYDFLAHRALDHYTNERSYLTQPAYKFYLDNEAAFAPAETFVNAKFPTRDSTSGKWLAVKLYQRVTSALLNGKNEATLIDAELMRLEFAYNNAVVEGKDQLYENALMALHKKYYNHPSDPEIVLKHAQQLRNKSLPAEGPRENLRQAVTELKDAVQRHPNSFGAPHCQRMIQEIESTFVRAGVEEANLPDQPVLIKVDYKNLSKVWVKVVSIPAFADWKENVDWNARIEKLNTIRPVQQRTWALANPGDYYEHQTELSLSALPIGRYVVLVSENEGFNDKKGYVAYTEFSVTKLAPLAIRDGNAGKFIVVNRATGEPLAGVKGDFYRQDWDYNASKTVYRHLGSAQSDANGLVDPDLKSEHNALAFFSMGKDSLWAGAFYDYRKVSSERRTTYEARFFTDRSIYRPGQTVYFKALLFSVDAKEMPAIVPNQTVEVKFYDANQQEKGHLSLKSNEFGTINGTFTAPAGGLTGQMHITVPGYSGAAYFNVEEYKRPRFEVKFKPVEGAYRVDDNVTMRGEARNYAGNVVDGASVKYRVVRMARFPFWDGGWWRRIPWRTEQMEIANGVTQTDVNGNFEVKFAALPDRAIPQKDQPVFDYTVYADVTDINGETRSSQQSVSAGYVALSVSWNLDEAMELDSLQHITLTTSNLAGQFQVATGEISIQKLLAPKQFFRQRLWEKPDVWTIPEADFRRDFPDYAWKEEDNPDKWGGPDFARTVAFNTANDKMVDLNGNRMEAGYYRIILKTKDAYGTPVELKKVVRVWDDRAPQTRFDEPSAAAAKTVLQPGETASIQLGGRPANLRFFFATRHRDGLKNMRWITTNGLEQVKIPVTENDRGGISVFAFAVYNNRVFVAANPLGLSVPWTNKQLDIRFETFRDKLEPGQQEEWRLKISGPNKDRVAAEMVAAMYDASLDQFLPHGWAGIDFPYTSTAQLFVSAADFSFNQGDISYIDQGNYINAAERIYPRLSWFGFPLWGGGEFYMMANDEMLRAAPAMAPAGAPARRKAKDERKQEMDMEISTESVAGNDEAPPEILEEELESRAAGKPAGPALRSNLNETVFFFPVLRTDAEGNVILSFKMNEALTRWKFLAFAHTKELQTALTTREVVTQKELMVITNPPRFLRAGDQLEFSAKVSNLSQQALSGTATLSLFDAATMQPLDARLGLGASRGVPFSVPTGQSAPVSWKISVPADFTGAVTWQVYADANQFRDGEESTLPVVTNRMLVTETMPVTVRGGQTRTFNFDDFRIGARNPDQATLRYTLEFTSNPAWYVVQSLPYLMEYPHECSEQVFSRYYANTLASSVTQKLPQIRKVYDRWKGTDAMKSNLSKNQELKYALLEETPWVLDAQNEEQQKQNIALLFDLNRMADEQGRALKTLRERQSSNGGWAWFPGGQESWYITQHIVTGFGHLQHLGAIDLQNDRQTAQMVDKALAFCDARLQDHYRELEKAVGKGLTKWEDDHLDPMVIHYLYARSFFSLDRGSKINAYYLDQAQKYWLGKGLYQEGMLALALHRAGRTEAAQKIVASLRERARMKEELGMYWTFDWGYYWYQLPIETQALMVEVFDEVANDRKAVEELRIWLLKNKQTNRWESTKATAEAAYALLLHGDNWLNNTQTVQVQVSGKTLKPAEVEPGTGYFKQQWTGAEVKPSWSKVTVENPNSNLVWGAAYWQYFEDLDKITGFKKTPLTIVKQLYREENSPTGPKLIPLNNGATLHVGDKVKVRIEIRVDRPMEYVHLKDMRAAGFEPVNVLSEYHWQGGLGYYESTKDLATHFFIDYLPQGTYVFEYPLRVSHRGDMSNGITTIQCMYAPEFTSHSEGIRVKVE